MANSIFLDTDNEVLSLINKRTSTRKFLPRSLTSDEKNTILSSAVRAPSAGAMMMYSIIEIEDPQTIQQLSVLADNQKFIAHAPWVLVFVADYAKWINLFEYTKCFSLTDVKHNRPKPGFAELILSAQDTMLAAGNAMTAAESLGLGSCFIGDVVENAEEIARLLKLPQYTLPLSMLVIGQPYKARPQTPHPTCNIIMHETYQEQTPQIMDAQIKELDKKFFPHATDTAVRVKDIYCRKHTSDFVDEMERSVRVWIDNWRGKKSLRDE